MSPQEILPPQKILAPQEIIELLGLQPHPKEGGYYREIYRSADSIPGRTLPAFAAARSVGTAIYYLLTPTTCSAMHRLPGDEIFHHYLGGPVEMLLLHASGKSELLKLGSDLAAGQRPQIVVPGGVWQGSKLAPGGRVALLGTTMSPGFDFADYQHGDRDELSKAFASQSDRIRELTPVR